MIDRKQAIVLIKKYIKNEDLLQQSLIVEAILRKIAKILGNNEETWGLTGLLYNIDYEYTQEEPEKRGVFASQLLEGLLPEDCNNAIKSNNYRYSDYIPSTALDKSLVATVAMTNFIISFIGITSLKNFSNINILRDKLNEPNFTDINLKKRILLCNDIGISLNNFLQLNLKVIQDVLNKI